MKKKFILSLCVGLVFMLCTATAFSAAGDEKGKVNSLNQNTNSDEKGRVNSLNQKMATVPNVVGMTYKNAIPVIQNAGFSAKANGPESLSQKIKKTVASQTPVAGKSALKGSFVVVDLR